MAPLTLSCWRFACVALFSLFPAFSSTNILNGKHFRLASRSGTNVTRPDYNLYYDVALQTYRGVSPDLWRWMAQAGNFTYSFVTVPLNGRGPETYLNATLVGDQFNFTGELWTVETAVLQRYEVTVPVLTYGWIIVTTNAPPGKPSYAQRVLTVVRPLSPEVWGATFLAVFVAGVLYWWLERDEVEGDFEPEDRPAKYGIPKSVWMCFMSLTGAGGHGPVTLPARVFAVAWTFVIMVLLAVYTANLAAFFTAPIGKQLKVGSFQDIAASGQPVCCTGNYGEAFLRTRLPASTPIINTPDGNYRDALLKVAHGECVAGVDKDIRYRTALQETSLHPSFCKLHLVNPPHGYQTMAFVAGPGTDEAVVRAIDELLTVAFSRGIHDSLLRTYLGASTSDSSRGCSPSPSPAPPPVTLAELSGLFIMFAASLLGSLSLHWTRTRVVKGVVQLAHTGLEIAQLDVPLIGGENAAAGAEEKEPAEPPQVLSAEDVETFLASLAVLRAQIDASHADADLSLSLDNEHEAAATPPRPTRRLSAALGRLVRTAAAAGGAGSNEPLEGAAAGSSSAGSTAGLSPVSDAVLLHSIFASPAHTRGSGRAAAGAPSSSAASNKQEEGAPSSSAPATADAPRQLQHSSLPRGITVVAPPAKRAPSASSSHGEASTSHGIALNNYWPTDSDGET